MRPFVAIALGLSLGACVNARALSLGPPVPPRPPGCDVELLRVEPHEAAERWQQVGAICLTRADAPNGTVDGAYVETRDEIVDAACRLGGEVVSAVGTCSNGKMPGIEFGVYRPR